MQRRLLGTLTIGNGGNVSGVLDLEAILSPNNPSFRIHSLAVLYRVGGGAVTGNIFVQGGNGGADWADLVQLMAAAAASGLAEFATFSCRYLMLRSSALEVGAKEFEVWAVLD